MASGGIARELTSKEADIQKMLAAEVHLGAKNCDFQMERYVFKRRNDGAESLIHSSSSLYNMAMVDEAVSYQNMASLNSTKTDRKILIRVTRLWLSIFVEDESFDFLDSRC
ncbi:hypothetical protein ACET3Z_023851 [Daucus carota]